MATEYKVLVSETGLGEWTELVGTFTAGSSEAAIRAAATDHTAETGAYVAVPVRSWKRFRVEPVTSQSLRVNPLTRASVAA